MRKFAKEASLSMLDFKARPDNMHGSKFVSLRSSAFTIKAAFSVLSVKMVPRTSTSGAKGLLQTYRKL